MTMSCLFKIKISDLLFLDNEILFSLEQVESREGIKDSQDKIPALH